MVLLNTIILEKNIFGSIIMRESSNNEILNNDVTNGIRLSKNSLSSIVDNNEFDKNYYKGIDISYSSNNNIVSNNIITSGTICIM